MRRTQEGSDLEQKRRADGPPKAYPRNRADSPKASAAPHISDPGIRCVRCGWWRGAASNRHGDLHTFIQDPGDKYKQFSGRMESSSLQPKQEKKRSSRIIELPTSRLLQINRIFDVQNNPVGSGSTFLLDLVLVREEISCRWR